MLCNFHSTAMIAKYMNLNYGILIKKTLVLDESTVPGNNEFCDAIFWNWMPFYHRVIIFILKKVMFLVQVISGVCLTKKKNEHVCLCI